MPELDLLCVFGLPHTWRPTGIGYYQWASNDSWATVPANAPYVREEVCTCCGSTRYVPATSQSHT